MRKLSKFDFEKLRKTSDPFRTNLREFIPEDESNKSDENIRKDSLTYAIYHHPLVHYILKWDIEKNGDIDLKLSIDGKIKKTSEDILEKQRTTLRNKYKILYNENIPEENLSKYLHAIKVEDKKYPGLINFIVDKFNKKGTVEYSVRELHVAQKFLEKYGNK